jgi:hypothetical protein
MQKGSARPQRARELCRMLRSRRADNWIGKVQKLSTNGDGWGVLSIDIGSQTHLQTWNNSVSDAVHKTMLHPASSLFQTASNLKKGDEVVFSALFFESDVDCVWEGSMTLAGSIKEPDYIVRFLGLAKR